MTDVTDLLWMNQALRGQKASHIQVEQAYHGAVEAAVDTIAGLQAQAVSLQAELAEARRLLAETRGELALKTSQHAGVLAQAKALKGELVAVAPQSQLLAKVGGVYPDGTVRLALNVVFEKAFDEKISSYKFPLAAHNYRSCAK